VRDERKSS